MDNISETIKAEFKSKKIVIVGDLVADQFLHGTIKRISREAPVFIISHSETETLAGGAANAAVNVASLGGNAVLVGITGNDPNGQDLIGVLESSSVDCRFLITADDFSTTTKTRVLAAQNYAQRQQVVRIDYENEESIGESVRAKLIENVSSAAQEADAIIISDYSYGVAGAEIADLCLKIADRESIPLLVDSRTRLKEFSGVTTATPNQEEIEQILGQNFTDAQCEDLRSELGLEALLITLGNKGMLLVQKDLEPIRIDVVGSKAPADVTGAGDTVIAAYALGLASGLGFPEAAKLANHAGGNVVMKKGTASVTLGELCDSLERETPTDFKTQSR
ncbi:MAG: hypothetical protein HKN25_02465 [Pyrinomonadaceae bacterium]|nr:hypothetical protein [Pyrinomonadaceae bacterium]